MSDAVQILAQKLNLDPGRFRETLLRAPFAYRHHRIPKKNGGYRDIAVPEIQLKLAQSNLLREVLYKKVHFPDCAHGGIPGRSIKTNAQKHIRKQVVVNFDLKDFFPSAHRSKIERALAAYKFESDLIPVIVRLVTHKHQLPQGAPTSPFISNLVFLECDRHINNFCNRVHLTYTRYFDDITVSGKNAHRFAGRIGLIISQAGFSLNRKKFQVQHRNGPQYVTGLVVNKNVELPEGAYLEICAQVEILERRDLSRFGTEYFFKDLQVLQGKIAFLKGIRAKDGQVLQERFEKSLDRIGLGNK